jgi:orotidine-5'-phosphate decarboxylase
LAALHNKTGLLVNASRAIIYASLGSDYAAAAKTVAETYAAEMATYLK